MSLDIWDRHAADMDDVCFSVAAAALFSAVYACMPHGEGGMSAPPSAAPWGWQQQTFALLTVTTESVPIIEAIWIVQQVLAVVLYR